MHDPKSNRRAFLRGTAGVVLGLPIVGFSTRGETLMAEPASTPKRLFTLFFPGGTKSEFWNLADGTGALGPLVTFGLQSVVTPIRNLSFPAASTYAGGSMNPHAVGVGAIFSGASLPTDRNTARNQSGGPTIDWIAANTLKPPLGVKALSLSLDAPSFSPDPMMGLHEEVTSWIDGAVPCRPILDPLKAFNLLFGGFAQDREQRHRQLTLKKSLLDNLLGDFKKYGSSKSSPLGAEGSALLRQHFEELRALEKQATDLLNPNAQTCQQIPQAPTGRDQYSYDSYLQVYTAHREILFAAMKCDLVRFGNLAFSGAVSNLQLPGYTEDNHHAAHFSNAGTTSHANYFYYVRNFIIEFGYLLKQMHEHKEANGNSMLENSCVVVATEMGDGLSHDFGNISMLVAGGKGTFPNTPVDAGQRSVNDVLVSSLQFLGLKQITSLGNPAHNGGPLFPTT